MLKFFFLSIALLLPAVASHATDDFRGTLEDCLKKGTFKNIKHVSLEEMPVRVLIKTSKTVDNEASVHYENILADYIRKLMVVSTGGKLALKWVPEMVTASTYTSSPAGRINVNNNYCSDEGSINVSSSSLSSVIEVQGNYCSGKGSINVSTGLHGGRA